MSKEKEISRKLNAQRERERESETLGSTEMPDMLLAFSIYFFNSGSGLDLRFLS